MKSKNKNREQLKANEKVNKNYNFLLFEYKFRFLVVLENNKIIKIEPYFGLYKKKTNKKYNLTGKKVKEIEFKEIKNYKLDFKNKKIYKKLYFILNKEKRLFTYKELAEKLNLHPRKVAFFLKSNPFLILIPCHRVIKNNGEISGYVLGKEVKKELLKFENLFNFNN
ncbi:MAG: MGMT family protein [Nanoarchaeota archaeon]